MREVGAFEAKNKLGQLLDLVEQGEVVVITRHGKEVARLVPARPVRNREQARAALQRIRDRAEKLKLGVQRRIAERCAEFILGSNSLRLQLVRVEIVSGRRTAVSLVLDSSATLAWIYGDETTDPIRRVFAAVADDGAIVPTLWRLEIANSLTVAVGRGRINSNFRRAALAISHF